MKVSTEGVKVVIELSIMDAKRLKEILSMTSYDFFNLQGVADDETGMLEAFSTTLYAKIGEAAV
jgi:hypothetical protein